ncbi:hypothetical protein DE4576_05525 [Mycobacterium marinum]|nr:hypothetical protein DE4576_05525 [Mycobacterium marinum]
MIFISFPVNVLHNEIAYGLHNGFHHRILRYLTR